MIKLYMKTLALSSVYKKTYTVAIHIMSSKHSFCGINRDYATCIIQLLVMNGPVFHLRYAYSYYILLQDKDSVIMSE